MPDWNLTEVQLSAELETRIDVIAALAEPHWADNWNFRAYLEQNVDPIELDRAVKQLNHEISSKIDCTACGNCCREIYPHITGSDVTRLASGLGLSESEIAKKLSDDGHGGHVFCERPCPMLKENKCTVYNVRPDDCREYPHLHKDDFLGGSIGTIENYGTCPIIFNVYGHLKTKFSYDPTRDYIGDSDPEIDSPV